MKKSLQEYKIQQPFEWNERGIDKRIYFNPLIPEPFKFIIKGGN